MEPQSLWIVLHVLLLVYWLGADITVFICSFQMIRRRNSPATRAAFVRVLSFANAFPGVAAVLMLPVGLQLAAGIGASEVSGAWLWLVWAGAIGWLAIDHLAGRRGKPSAKAFSRVSLWIRLVLIAVLAAAAVLSFATGRPFATDWLALKVLLFAYVLACGLGIRFAFQPFGPAFGRLMAEGPTEGAEAALRRPVLWVKPWVLALWAGLVVMAFIGISQPRF